MTALVVGVLSIISTIILGILQYKKWKADAEDAETKTQQNLVSVALNINKQEMDTLRGVNESLRMELQEKNKRITDLETRVYGGSNYGK